MAITESHADVLTLIGETAAALLPADEQWSIVPAGDEIVLPGGSNEAVGAQVGAHVVAVVVASKMSRRIQVGPPPAEGLLDGLAPVIEAIAQVLSIGEPGEIVAMNPQAVIAGATEGTVAVALADGDAHVVTLVVSPPSTVVDDEAAAMTFEPIVADGMPGSAAGLEMLHEVTLGVTVELGRTSMPLRDILSIVPGSVIELDRPASAPVDVLVNGTLIARGEVVVIDEEFGIRITEVLGQGQSITGDHAVSEVSVGELFVRLIVSLGVVIAIMAAAAWALKRMTGVSSGGGKSRPGRPIAIEVLARQTLGRRSSVALIRAGDRGLVLGITEQHVTLLAETSADELTIEPTPRTVSVIDDQQVVGSPWRSLTETLRDRTVRRS